MRNLFNRRPAAVTVVDEWGTARTYADAEQARAAHNRENAEHFATVSGRPAVAREEW